LVATLVFLGGSVACDGAGTGALTPFKKGILMRNTLSALTLAVLVLSAGHALAQEPVGPKTREQVRTELMEAIRTGNMPANDDSGRMLNEVNPSAYPPKVVAPCKTREQVRAELAEAQRTGNMPANDDSGCMLNEINPSAYPPKPVVPCKTREQVRAELDEAKRTGNMPAPDESGCMLKDMYPDLYPKR
jgi:hypothetical protein